MDQKEKEILKEKARKIKELSQELKKNKDKEVVLEKLQKEKNDLHHEINKTEEYYKKYNLSSKEFNKYLDELNINKAELKRFAKENKISSSKEKAKKVPYSVYKTNPYALVSNIFMENLSFKLSNAFPDQFKKLSDDLVLANINILSRTYISVILFSTLITLPIAFILLLIMTKSFFLSLVLAILFMPLVMLFIYKYPSISAAERAKKIKNELVFGIVHMSSIAGSGAHPVRIFELLINSNEYDELEIEMKKIMNYINLFGYSLSKALKEAAGKTPSAEFKELLHGMTSTVETGGDIKDYLKDKSKDSLVSFRLDQKKYVEKIATYSDIYTGILIAAPLLFIVTLAILERISPELGGIKISTISLLGVFVLLPILNILFMLILETDKNQI